MRDIALFCFIFGLLPFVLKNHFWGVLLFTWVSLMNPHRLTYAAAYDFPFEATIAVVTLISLLISKQKKQLPVNGVIVTLMLFIVWMSLTTLFALEPERAWNEWNRVIKTMFLFAIVLVSIDTKKEIQLFVAVIALSIGFFGFKGGLFTIAHGGFSNVYGPEGSYIQDNNALALAIITVMPLIWYLSITYQRILFRVPVIALLILCAVSVAGSYSRGAILGGAVMLMFLMFKSHNKFRIGVALVLMIAIAGSVMPDQWFNRMHTIDNYQADPSALGRINAWGFAVNLANSKFLGGGFNCFTHRQFLTYAPDPHNHHAAHSIYFQVLGEHGYLGLFLFILFLFLTWRTGNRILKRCKGRNDLNWATNLAAMCQVSMAGFLAGGAFLTLAYYDLLYDIVAVLLVLEKFLATYKEPDSVTDAVPIIHTDKEAR